jgi:Flp pilus assembly pilin Flp
MQRLRDALQRAGTKGGKDDVKHYKLIEELHDRLRLASGQTMAEYAVALTVISATTVLAFTNLSAAVRTAVTSVVGLLP